MAALAFAVLALCLPTGAGAARAHHASRQVRLAAAVSAEPDSSTIDGPDCGHAKQIIGKWQKASEVGKLAGAARGAITAADSAAAAAQAAATRAQEVGQALDPNGQPAANASTELAATAANEAASAATAASTALDTELQTFKGSVTGSSFSGSDVTDAEMLSLKNLTEQARTAAKLALAAAERAAEKAEEAQAEGAKKADEVARVLAGLLSKAGAALEAAAGLVQRAGWDADDAQVVEGKAGEALAEVEQRLQTAGNQTPVWNATKFDLQSKKDSLTELRTNTSADASELNTTANSLKTALTPLKEASETLAGGNAAQSVNSEVLAAEELLDNTTMGTAALKAKLQSLARREEQLQAAIEDFRRRNATLA